jgi:hypothetical protein
LGAVVLTCIASVMVLHMHGAAYDVCVRGTAHLERDGVGVWVLEMERLGDLLLEGACSVQSLCTQRRVHWAAHA